MTRLLPLFLCIVVGSASARADELEELNHEGVELRKQGQDEAALERFRRAYEIDRSPRSLAQIALAEQALGRWVEADADLRRALDAVDDSWIVRNREPLESAQRAIAERIGELTVVGPPGASLFVDGISRGALPLAKPLRLPAGFVALEVRLAGRLPVSRQVLVPAHGAAREEVVLAAPPLPAPETAAPGWRPATAPVPETPRNNLRLAAWATLGASSTALAAGVLATVFDRQSALRWNDDGACLQPGKTRYQVCGADYAEARAAQVVSIVSYALSGALAVGATTLFVLSRKRARAHQEHLSAALGGTDGCEPVFLDRRQTF
jgi:tetratricopeptide (TPR) repeat protein